jgi:hypothetical protein
MVHTPHERTNHGDFCTHRQIKNKENIDINTDQPRTGERHETMRYGTYSSSEVKLSSDDEVKEKSYSSSSFEIAGIDGLGGGGGGEMPSNLLSAVCFSLIVISLA